MPHTLESFLQKYIPVWDRNGAAPILELLSYLSVRHFRILKNNILASLEAKVIDNSLESKMTLLNFYASLLDHWTNLTVSGSMPPQSNKLGSLQTTAQLLEYASTLSLSLLEHSHSASEDAVLSFFERLAYLFSHASFTPSIRISLPSARLIYLLAFTSNLSTLSRLCNILALYKQGFEASMIASKDPNSGISPYSVKDVNMFNGYVMDVCNMLWRNRALNHNDPNALGCLLPEKLHASIQAYLDASGGDYTLPTLFSLSYHCGLSAASAACFREAEDAANETTIGGLKKRLHGPATQKSLFVLEKEGGFKKPWSEYRLEVLQWLEDKGSEGVSRLMRNTMKILRQIGTQGLV
jgi:centromere protein I